MLPGPEMSCFNKMAGIVDDNLIKNSTRKIATYNFGSLKYKQDKPGGDLPLTNINDTIVYLVQF